VPFRAEAGVDEGDVNPDTHQRAHSGRAQLNADAVRRARLYGCSPLGVPRKPRRKHSSSMVPLIPRARTAATELGMQSRCAPRRDIIVWGCVCVSARWEFTPCGPFRVT
jgi:hypothetical protein